MECPQRLAVYITLIALAAILTLFTFDTWETVLLVSLLLIGISYVALLATDRLFEPEPYTTEFKEGFTSREGEGKRQGQEEEAKKTRYEWLENDELFDEFYASVFTKLTQNEKLLQAETAICLQEFSRQIPKTDLTILDAGCGIGIASCSFAKQGVRKVVGIDKSRAMIQYAKNHTLPSTTLTDAQRRSVDFRIGDLMGPTTAMASEYDAACLLYFTVYYMGRDLDTLFRNLHLWVKPGGTLAIEAVNKYKFEPVLDSSNPWIGVSPQRYKKDRITTSKVVFDKFDYEANFELDDPRSEFREIFRFKDGSVRRQRHRLYMPSIKEIIRTATNTGWTYTKYVDMMPMAFSYGYLLFFTRNPE
jgi:2-polyprenyl-3-methyl-5-hydroxy-6-metoxy-1,4-benzoquinol methylase